MKRQLQVVAAMIIRNGKVFVAQRGYGELEDLWEFPGGKINPGEAAEEALKREIYEELNAEIKVGEKVTCVNYAYDFATIHLDCYLCTLASSDLTLLEHKGAKWVNLNDLDSVNWCEADRIAANDLKNFKINS